MVTTVEAPRVGSLASAFQAPMGDCPWIEIDRSVRK